MRIGFFGNANNSPLMLARALRSAGHDVLFVVDRWEPLNRPENKYPDLAPPYPDWIVDVSPLDLWQYPAPPPAQKARAIELLKSCDVVILNQYGLSLASEIGKPTVALLTGTDLVELADYRHYDKFAGPVRDFFLQHVNAQREGIRSAFTVIYLPKGLLPESDRLLHEIGVADERRIYYQMAELDLITPYPAPVNNSPLRVFCIARLTWQQIQRNFVLSELDYKGSDIMIRGLGLFWRTTRIPLDIRLIRKGADVEATEELAREEGLADQVTWLDEMSQQDVLEQYRIADIVFEQMGGSVIGMGGIDAMAAARPVIANGRPEIFDQVRNETSPVCQAATPQEVCAQLRRLAENPAEREQIGQASRFFAERHFSAGNAAKTVMDRVYGHFALAHFLKATEYHQMKLELKQKETVRQLFR